MWVVVLLVLAPSQVATPTQFESPGVIVTVLDARCMPLPLGHTFDAEGVQ